MSILGHGLQLDLDTVVLFVSWKVVVCGANATSDGPFWDARVPAQCEPFSGVIDVYLNEYVQVPSTVQSPVLISTSICRLSVAPSLSKPIFSPLPHTKLISKQLG